MGALTRFIDLRAGEAALLVKSALTLFGLIAAHTMLETARDALFLQRLPADRLPFVYVLLAGLALIVSRANTRFVQRFGRRNALIFTLFAAAYGTTVLFLLPRTDAVVFGLYAWSGLLGSVLVVQFWMYAGQTFTVAQGKRLFGPITAGGVLGAVAGASFSVAALQFTDVHHLLVVGSVVLVGTAMLLTTAPLDEVKEFPGAMTANEARRSFFRLFSEQPYLLRLSGLIALSTAALLITDYLFKSVARANHSPDELGTFFAGYYAVLNVAALLVQLFVGGKVVRRAGVIAAFSVLPMLLLAGSIGTVIAGGAMLAVLLTKGAEGSLKHSLHRIASELLWMPLPDHVRTESKVIVDTVFVRGAQALTATGLLGLAMFELDRPQILGAILTAMCLLWLAMSMRLRHWYLGLFRRALHRVTPEQRSAPIELDIRSVEVVVEALSSREPERSISAIDLLVSNNRTRLIPALILYHESPQVLVRALPAVSTETRQDWVPLAERLLEHEVEEVRIAALRALAGAGVASAIERRLLDLRPRVRAHAAFWLAHLDEAPPQDEAGVQQILAMPNDEHGRDAKVGLLEAIESAGDTRWSDVLMVMCEEETDAFVEPLVLAISRVQDPRFIPRLIDRLRYRANRGVVREAIVSMGDEALDALVERLRDDRTDIRILRHIPRTISRFGTQRAADILTGLLVDETPGRIRYKVLRGLGRLVSEQPVRVDRLHIERRIESNLIEALRLTALSLPLHEPLADDVRNAGAGREMLVELLEDKAEQAMERAFRLLQIAHRSEDIHSVSFAVSSTEKRVRAQALEYLDALTLDAAVPAIRDLLRIVVDDLSPAERVQRAAAFLPAPPRDAEAALSILLHENDSALANLAGYHALQLGLKTLRQSVITATEERPVLASLRTLIDLTADLSGAPTHA